MTAAITLVMLYLSTRRPRWLFLSAGLHGRHQRRTVISRVRVSRAGTRGRRVGDRGLAADDHRDLNLRRFLLAILQVAQVPGHGARLADRWRRKTALVGMGADESYTSR